MTQQINLYRPIFRKQEKKFSAVAMTQAGVVMVVGIAAIYALMWWQLQATRSDLQAAEKRLADATTQLQGVTQKFGVDQNGPTEAEILEREITARREIRKIIDRNLIGNHRGYSDYLMALSRQHVDGVWITALSIVGSGDAMRLEGRTIDPARVPRFMQRLANEGALKGKQFELFMMTSDGNNSSHEFTLQTNGDAGVAGGNS